MLASCLQRASPHASTHSQKEEELYACAWTVDQPSGEPLLAVGGVRGVVKVINASRQEVARTLVGHGAMINDVKWHPITPSMLLTASKDESIRLWNVATNTCVAVFAGEAGHRDDVLSVSIHPIGNCFASAVRRLPTCHAPANRLHPPSATSDRVWTTQ